MASHRGGQGFRSACAGLAGAVVLSIAVLAGSASASASDPGFQLTVAAGRMADISGTPAVQNYIGALGVATDTSGNLYIADNHGYIEKVAPDGTLTIVAGNGTDGVPVAGPATSSPITPDGVAVGADGNIYIADIPYGDAQMGYVLKVTPSGTLSILAGNGTDGLPAAGQATASGIGPRGLAVDTANNVYVAGDNVVAKITPAGTLSVIAGDENAMTPPSSGVATATNMNPVGVAVDATGNLYIADEQYTGPAGEGRIDKVAPSGALTVIAGNGQGGAPTPGLATASPLNPTGVAVDAAGDVYVSNGSVDTESFNGGYLVEVTTGGALSVVGGDGSNRTPTAGPVSSSAMNPVGVATDAIGDIYVANSSGYRAGYALKVSTGSTLSIVAGVSGAPTPGPATSSPLEPNGVAVDSAGDLYIVDQQRYIEKVTPDGTLSIVAGNGTVGAPVPGPAISSPMQPLAVAVDTLGNVYIADQGGYVDKVTPSGTLSVITGSGGLRADQASGGPATSYSFTPLGLAVDSSGNLYIADGARVYKVDPSGELTFFAGNGRSEGTYGSPTPGPATASPMQPIGLATDRAKDVYIADKAGWVEKVDTSGTLSVIAGAGVDSIPLTSNALQPSGVAVDSTGDVFIADGSAHVEELTPGGTLSVVAGNGSAGPPASGAATSTSVEPNGIAVDSSGNVYISDDQADVPFYTLSTWDQGFVDKIAPPTSLTVPPPTQPASVNNLTATAQPNDATTYTFSWDAADSNGSTVTNYTLTCGTKSWSVPPGSNYIVTATESGFSLGSHTCGVTATNAIGTGPAANVSFTASLAPNPVTVVTATPSGSNVAFSWPAATPNESPVTNYALTCGGRSWNVPPGTGSSVMVSESGFAPGPQSCGVTATNAQGTSAATNTSFNVILPPTAPISLQALPNGSSFALTWSIGAPSGAPISGYSVSCELAGGRIINTNTTTTNLRVINVVNGTQHCKVNEHNSAGTSPSTAVTFIIKVPPSTPAHMGAVWIDHGHRLRVRWSASRGNGYPVTYLITDGRGHRWLRTGLALTIRRPSRGLHRYVVHAITRAGQSGAKAVTIYIA